MRFGYATMKFRSRRLLSFAATILWLTACAPGPVASREEADELVWDSTCYDDMAHVVAELAGPTARDCGLLGRGAADAARARFRQCVRSALAGDAPFAMGRASRLPDASRCTAAIRAEGGQLWEVYYDFDYDHGAPASGNGIAFRWVLQLSRCESIRPLSASAGHFQLEDCIEDEAATQRMLGERQRRNDDA
jgi:hypothetical protein